MTFPKINGFLSRLGSHFFAGLVPDPEHHVCACGADWRNVYDGRVTPVCPFVKVGPT